MDSTSRALTPHAVRAFLPHQVFPTPEDEMILTYLSLSSLTAMEPCGWQNDKQKQALCHCLKL